MTKLNWMTKASAVILLWATAAVALPAQTFTSLHRFDGTDGSLPGYDGLVQATDGNMYGVTAYGGISSNCAQVNLGCGTVFQLTPTGTLTTIYNFCSLSGCADGQQPSAGVIQGSDGNLYGTTFAGGTTDTCIGGRACGTLFKITLGGTLTTLHSFTGTDGSGPLSALIQASDGNFYGTTFSGGAHDPAFCDDGIYMGCGTAFKMTPDGTLTTLHNFCAIGIDCTDGDGVQGGLVQGADGSLYGTTSAGGTALSGTFFKIASGVFTSLSSFPTSTLPYGTLVQSPNGNFFGTTSGGGTSGDGTFFSITPGGVLTTLHSFDETDGSVVYATLVIGTDGNFYGTTYEGGTNNNGTAYSVTPSGTVTTLHSFVRIDGLNPVSGVIQNTNGSFYGTTYKGGPSNDGTIYRLSLGLRAFVGTQPASGLVGAAVNLLGTNLTGATSVTFNGTAAAFTVVSPSLITTTVPTGATSGKVQVTIPSGTLSSNAIFRVQP
jgi:uncharacterized repeat protein (TIGR03803 family)